MDDPMFTGCWIVIVCVPGCNQAGKAVVSEQAVRIKCGFLDSYVNIGLPRLS